MTSQAKPWVWIAIGALAGLLLLTTLACAGIVVLRAGLLPPAPTAAPMRAIEAIGDPLPPVTVAPVALPARDFVFEDRASSLYIKYILDASGSMMGQLPDGSYKRDVAREVLIAHIRSFPSETHVGLDAFGHRLPWQGQEDASCQDIELIAPVGTGNRGIIANWLEDFQAQGMTPLSLAIRQALDDFVHDPDRINSIIMISDGEETCGGDPCQLVTKLKRQDINFTLYVVGLDVDQDARTQLSCIAEEGGGVYYDVESSEEMALVLVEIEKEIVARLPAPTPTPRPTVTPAPTPAPVVLDTTDSRSVLAWVQHAVAEQDSSLFVPLLYGDDLSYVMYIEGGQPVTNEEFLADLQRRLPSRPSCDRYRLDNRGDVDQVWFSGWEPPWVIDHIVYDARYDVDPPHTSNTAAFFFSRDADNNLHIAVVWVNEYDEMLIGGVFGDDYHACSAMPLTDHQGRSARFGPEAVPSLPNDVDFSDCYAAHDAKCIIDLMRENDASDESIDFVALAAELTGDVGFLAEFREVEGPVDIGYVFYPTRANGNYQMVLLNGSPPIVPADDLPTATHDAIKADRVYQTIQRQNAGSVLFIWTWQGRGEGVQQTESGQQRFFHSYPIKDCGACEVLGYAFVAFEFDGDTGRFLGARLMFVTDDYENGQNRLGN
jgi:hypothetical protein